MGERKIYFLKKLAHAFRKHGFSIFRKAFAKIYFSLRDQIDTLSYICFFDKKELLQIFEGSYSFIDLSLGKIQWDGTLVQRYKQVSIQFSKMDGLVFAGSLPQIDNVRLLRKISDNLYIINPNIKPLIRDIENFSKKKNLDVLVRVQSTDFSITFEQILKWKEKGFKVLYEYVDPFHEDISGPIPNSILLRHRQVLADHDIYFCATAKNLLGEAGRKRGKSFLSQNAVQPSHWKKKFEEKENSNVSTVLSKIRTNKLPIVGYHGALAKWINYPLLIQLVETNRFSLLLIGQEYDNSLKESGLLGKKNVFYLGPVDYAELPNYASCYDISIIPFVFSTLSDGVSPIKLFEYMALGRPIVVTNNSELKDYRSCIKAIDNDDFIKKLDLALQLKNDQAYLETLHSESQRNTWEKRCEDMLKHCEVKVST